LITDCIVPINTQVNSAFYPRRDWKLVVIYGPRGEDLVRLVGVVVCLVDAPRIQLFADAGNGWPHMSALRYH